MQRILDAVADEVFENAAHLAAVRPDGKLLFGQRHLERKAARLNGLLLLRERLPHERGRVQTLAVHLLHARAHLGDVEQVARPGS